MQMIDVLKRLAELDAVAPAVDARGAILKTPQGIAVRESAVAECGMMPEMGGIGSMVPPPPPMPASINMTAGSGDELSNMLATIMQLAGVKQYGEPAADMPPPAVATTSGDDSPADTMRSVIDRLNPDDEMSADQGDVDNDGDHDMDDHDAEKKEPVDEYDNTPADPTDKNEFDADAFAHQENQPGQGDRMDGDKPKAYADMNEAVTDLFAQYKRFVSEN
jgi:hypothetical protein